MNENWQVQGGLPREEGLQTALSDEPEGDWGKPAFSCVSDGLYKPLSPYFCKSNWNGIAIRIGMTLG
jgi:hypothetical protein